MTTDLNNNNNNNDNSNGNGNDNQTFDNLLTDLSAGGSSSEQQRWEAAIALGTLRDRRAVKPLVMALNDEAATVRFEVGVALGKIGDGQAASGLLEILRRVDEEESVTQAAGIALTRLDTGALPLLIEALHNPQENSMLRTYVAGAIGEIGLGWQLHLSQDYPQPQAQPPLDFDLQLAPDQAALRALLTAVRQEDFNWNDLSVRMNIVQGLGAVGRGERGVLELLGQVLRREDEANVVRCEAAWALGRLGGSQARQELIAVAKLVEEETAGSAGERELLKQNIEAALKETETENEDQLDPTQPEQG